MEDTGKFRPSPLSQEGIGSYSFWQVLKLLNPEHLFASIIIMMTLMGVMFGIGYKYLVKRVTAERIQSITEQSLMDPNHVKLKSLQTKERFLSLYVNYLYSKQQYSEDASAETRDQLARCRSDLEGFMKEISQQGATGSDIITIEEGRQDASGTRHLFVTFSYDNSTLLMDSELGPSLSSP